MTYIKTLSIFQTFEKRKYHKHLEAATVELKSSVLHEKETKQHKTYNKYNFCKLNKHKYIQDIKLFI